MMEYKVIVGKGTKIAVKLYKEEIEDIIRALDYYIENVELEVLNEKEEDKYEIWYNTLRRGFADILYEIDEEQ